MKKVMKKMLVTLVFLLTLLFSVTESYALDSIDIVNSCRHHVLLKDYDYAYKTGVTLINSNPTDFSGHYCMGYMYMYKLQTDKAELFLGNARNLLKNYKSVSYELKLVVDMNYLTSAIDASIQKRNKGSFVNEIERVRKDITKHCYKSGKYSCNNLFSDFYIFYTATYTYYKIIGNDRKACLLVNELLTILYDHYDAATGKPDLQDILNSFISEQERVHREFRCHLIL